MCVCAVIVSQGYKVNILSSTVLLNIVCLGVLKKCTPTEVNSHTCICVFEHLAKEEKYETKTLSFIKS